jgi:hypothetical protein
MINDIAQLEALPSPAADISQAKPIMNRFIAYTSTYT